MNRAKLLPAGLAASFLFGTAAAQDAGPVVDTSSSQSQVQAIHSYWTEQRMNTAKPRPVPHAVIARTPRTSTTQSTSGVPGVVNGHPPGGGASNSTIFTFSQNHGSSQASSTPQAFGPGPSNPTDYDNYGPFQRFKMHGKYLVWPRSVHGKLFFTLGGSNFVCSATVIGRSTIATAGHCVSDGAGGFASNLLFCPSYFENPTGPNPARGCWAGFGAVTSSPWHVNGDPDYDYACFVTNTTGDTVSDKIGNVTGWAGRAWNWDAKQPTMTFGYPAGSPFLGNTIQQTASVEWYEYDFTPGGPTSKVIGSDLTGGASGGGWFLSWQAPDGEIQDTDGVSETDPMTDASGPLLNGVNSHKSCLFTCQSPPTASQGVFWQEMTSPTFRSSGSDNADSEDIFAACLSHGNNNL